MNTKPKNRESIREVLWGGAAGAALGALVTFGIAFAITGSMVLAPIMAMQGAFTGAFGAGWAMVMLLVQTDDATKPTDVVPLPVSPKTELRRAA